MRVSAEWLADVADDCVRDIRKRPLTLQETLVLDLLDARAEAEELRKDAERRLVTAFVQGAKWWEYEKTNATMWQSDQAKAAEAAQTRVDDNTLGWTLEDIAAQRQKEKV